MTTPRDIRNKLEWEGWPDGLEWINADEVEDEFLKQAILDAHDAMNDLERIRDEIEDRIDELLEDEEDV